MIAQRVRARSSPSILQSVAVRDAVACLSYANLSFVRIWEGTLAYSKADAFYMRRLPSPADDLAIPAAVVIFAGILWGAVTIARRRLSDRTLRILRPLSLFFLIVPLNSLRLSAAVTRNIDLIALLSSRLVLAAMIPGLALLIWMCWKWQQQMIRVARTIMAILVTFTVLTFGEAIRAAVTFPGQPASLPVAPLLPGGGAAHRVLWVIFDEWDYGLTFERRPANLALPAVDRFRAESLSASYAQAPTLQTATSVPAMLIGTIPNGGAERIPWAHTPTIFSEARSTGVNSAIAGWYLPYCRIFPEFVTNCEWWSLPNALNSNGETFTEKVGNDLMSLVQTGARGVVRQPAAMRSKVKMFREFLRDGEEDVSNPSLGFVFLHAPIPHPPHPYNRATGTFDVRNSQNSGYFDSLALVDQTVAALRSSMEKAGLWNKTTILLTADHPLRQPIGKFDARAPYLLRFPGDSTTFDYAPHLRTIVTADLLLSVLRGEISSRAEAIAWLNRHHDDVQAPARRAAEAGSTPN